MNLPAYPPPSHINPAHWQEWLDSGVDPASIALNVRTVGGQEAIELILSEAIASRQKVTSYATVGTRHLLDYYSHLENGGWWVSGIDPLNNYEPMEWGQLKPNTPRPDRRNPKKSVKYEQPLNAKSRCLFPRQSYASTLKTALTLGLHYGQKFKEEINQEIERIRRLSPQWSTQISINRDDQDTAACGAANPKEPYHSRFFTSILEHCQRGEYRESLQLLRSVWDQSRSGCDESGSIHQQGDTGFGWLSRENPDYWRWIKEHNLPIQLTEGAKKAQSQSKCGFAAIALPGITMGARSEGWANEFRLHPDLEFFATPGREISLCFDFETKVKTIQTIERETEKLNRLFRAAGCEFKVINLPGPEKGVDDFIMTRGADAFHDLFQRRLTLDLWRTKRLSKLTHSATVTLNQRYLGELSIPDSAKLVGIKSPKGTGKTESFRPIVEEATRNGQRVLLISHRVQLAQAICDRVGLPYVTELRTSEEGALLGYGVCIDSLHPESQARFNAEFWHDAIVIIDECEQVILHLLEAKTEVAQRRTTILGQLKQLLMNTVESDHGKIILADADLSNISLDFVWGLLEQKISPHLIVNQYKPEDEAWQVYHYNQHKPDQWLAALCKEVESGGKPLIVVQAQGERSLWGSTTIEAYLNRLYPDTKGLRIDSVTISDSSHAAYNCAARINEIALQYDWIIASPTIETGISIDVRGHFTSVWGCLNGVTSENSARQSLARLRDPVDRHIWIRQRGTQFLGNHATTVRGLLGGEYQVADVAAKLLQVVCYQEELISAFNTSLTTWAKFASRINSGFIRYRESVLDGLREEGHFLYEAVPQFDTRELMADLKQVQATGHQASCEAIAQAEDITQKEFDQLKAKKAKTAEERQKERKFQIAQRYQVDVTPDLVAKDDDGWYPKLRLFYFLGAGKVFLKERDEQNLDNALKTSGPWIPTLNRAQLTTRVFLLERLGIGALLNLDEDFNGGTKANDYQDAHPSLRRLADLATTSRNQWTIKNVLGVTVNEKMSPIQIAQAILGKLGIKLKCDRQQGGKGYRQRIYRYVLPKDGRDEIIAGWFARDKSRNESEMHNPSIDLRDRQGGSAA